MRFASLWLIPLLLHDNASAITADMTYKAKGTAVAESPGRQACTVIGPHPECDSIDTLSKIRRQADFEVV